MLTDLEIIENKDACKGVFFRCYINNYWSETSIQYQTTFKLLKRKSCKGCSKCTAIAFEEDVEAVSLDEMEVHAPQYPVHGAIYELIFHPDPPDWETGIVDSWSWELRKVEEKHGS